MEGLNIQPPASPQNKKIEDLKSKQEAASFVWGLKSILGPYQLSVDSAQKDISTLDQKVKDDLILTIKNLIKERGFCYVSEENRRIVDEVKKMVGDTFGALIEKIAFGETNNETMDKVIERTADAISAEIDDKASFILKSAVSPDKKKEEIEKFAEEKIKLATKDNRWNPMNLGRLFSRIIDSVKTTWNGTSIKSLIVKIGRKIIKEREKDFIEHGI